MNSVALGRFRIHFPVDATRQELKKFSHEAHNFVAWKLQEMDDSPITDVLVGLSDDEVRLLFESASIENVCDLKRAICREARKRGKYDEWTPKQ